MSLDIFKYIFPFFLFALLTYAPELPGVSLAWAYPVKTVLVGLVLIWFWQTFRSEIMPCLDWLAIVAGVFVFLVWVGLEGMYPMLGSPVGFDPYALAAEGPWVYILICFRILGAVLVVPVMEEIFWRSFGLRVLDNSNFLKIPLGTFSWFPFIAVSVAFGIAHHRWLPGIIAGLIYAALLYRSKNLFSPILSHAVTNLLLAVYVLGTARWYFW